MSYESVKDSAKLIGVSVQLLRSWIDRGKVPVYLKKNGVFLHEKGLEIARDLANKKRKYVRKDKT